MSSSGERGPRGNGAGGGGGAAAATPAAGAGPIPETARKMVQSLKEIVSYYSDQEIYAALKECNMDPDDAISRLLNQDTFHEVKSKRDKKKEVKDASESKTRGVSNAHRGIRADRSATRPSSNNTISNEYGTSVKPPLRKDNGPHLQSSILGSGNSGNAIGRRSSVLSSPSLDAAINGPPAAGAAASQTSGFQQPWLGVPGQPSMADIVKMGRPRSSAVQAVATEVPISHRSPGNTHAVIEKPDKISEHVSHDGWSEQLPDVNRMNAAESSGSLPVLNDTSTLLTVHDTKSHTHQNSELESVLSREGNLDDENLLADTLRTVPSGNQQVYEDTPDENPNIDDSSFRNFSYYESQQPAFDDHNAEDDVEISSMTSTLQQLQLPNEEVGRKHHEQSRTVKFADHLQITSADCSHLSFGSFGTGLSANFSSSVVSESFKESPEVIAAAEETSPSDDLDDGKQEYYNEQQLMPIPDEDAAPQAPSTSLGYDQPSCSEPEPSGPDPSDPLRGMQHNFPSSLSSYQFSDSTEPNPSAHYTESNAPVQSHAPSPNTVMTHGNSLPRHLVESQQPAQEFDLPYSHLFASQPLGTRYTAAPSVSGPLVSLPEAVNPSLFSMPKETLQALAGSNVLPGPSVPQNISIQQQTQPSHPLGQYANVINYPFFPQSFSYMPSTLQQTYGGLGTGMGAYHLQEAAAHNATLKYSTLPDYKNLHVNSLQQPAAITSASPNVAAAYGDALGSQFKESNAYSTIHLNENPALWPQGSSRTISGMHANAYFNILSQNQQSNFRQTQQPSLYGGLSYPNMYHSQAVPQERQQNPGHMSLNGLQGIPSQPSHGSHQLWPNSYRSP